MQCIVYDLEATCWDGEPYADQSEIIEIAAYRIDRYGEIEGPFQKFVKPILFPRLSPYCMDLTSIEQADIDTAAEFDEVIGHFLDWGEILQKETVFCAWGKYDARMLCRDCTLHDIDYSWLNRTLDVKQAYNKLKGHKKALGLMRSCRKENIDFEGTPHRAIWDTYNLLKLFMKYYGEWNLPL